MRREMPGIQLRDRQRGVSLLVVLILLLVTSLLGVAVMRSSAMQERMSANLRDRSLGFEAAESTLRYVQNTVNANSILPMSWRDRRGIASRKEPERSRQVTIAVTPIAPRK